MCAREEFGRRAEAEHGATMVSASFFRFRADGFRVGGTLTLRVLVSFRSFAGKKEGQEPRGEEAGPPQRLRRVRGRLQPQGRSLTSSAASLCDPLALKPSFFSLLLLVPSDVVAGAREDRQQARDQLHDSEGPPSGHGGRRPDPRGEGGNFDLLLELSKRGRDQGAESLLSLKEE